MKQAPEGWQMLQRNVSDETCNLVFELNLDYEIVMAILPFNNALGHENREVCGKSIFQYIHPNDCAEVKAEFDDTLRVFSETCCLDYEDFNVGNVIELRTKDHVKTFLDNYSKILRMLSARQQIIYRFKRANGKLCWLESSIIPFLRSNGMIGITISSNDITDRIMMKKSLESTLKKLSKKSKYENIIRAITQDVHSSINLQEVFEKSVDAIHKNVTGAENVSIHVIDNDYAVIKAYRGYPDVFIKRIEKIPYPKDYTWKTIIGEKAIYCADVERDSIVGRVGREIGVKSYLSMPIHSRNSVLGVINISSTNKDMFDNDELMLLDMIAQQIETAINNARKAEELRKSDNRFRTLFENVPTGVYRITPEGKILDANPAFVAMLGFTSIEGFAMHGFQDHHFRPEDAWKELKEKIDLTGEIKGMESVWNKRDGTKIFVLENIKALRTSDGNILFYEGTVEDITKRKVAENKLRQVNLNLEKEIGVRTAQLLKANESLRKEINERKLKEYELKNSYAQLRALTKHLESVREDERVRISREVHDELGQSLTGLKIDLGLLMAQLSESNEKFQDVEFYERIRKMSALVDSTIQSVRRIAMELRPGVLDDLGTVAAIEWQAQDFEKLTGIKCRFNSEVSNIPLNQDESTALFRIFQEILTNVVRHSEASIVNVKLKEYRRKYVLEVLDNGIGISNDEIDAPQSLGLLGIKERALMFGGDVKITGKSNKGTTVSVGIPKGGQVND